jgi:hypothetical protein
MYAFCGSRLKVPSIITGLALASTPPRDATCGRVMPTAEPFSPPLVP